MKKLPEEDLWNGLKNRLGDYTEDPGDETWEKIAAALPRNPPSKGLLGKHQIASILLVLFAFLAYLLYEYEGESMQQATTAKIKASNPMVTEQLESYTEKGASGDNASPKSGNEVDDEAGKITTNSSVTNGQIHDSSETTDNNNSHLAFSAKSTAKDKQDSPDRYGEDKLLTTHEATNDPEPKITESGSVFTSSDELHENNKHKTTTSNTSKPDINSDVSNELETISSTSNLDKKDGLQSLAVAGPPGSDSKNRSDDNVYPGNVNRSSDVKQSSTLSKVDTDAQQAHKTIADSIVAEEKRVTEKSNAIQTKSEKQKISNSRFYFAITPSLAFAKVKPFPGDAENVTHLHSPAIFSNERFGLSIDAGIQRPLGKNVELYAGLSLYRQNQTIIYEYESPEVTVITDGGGGYSVSPGTVVSEFDYKMVNMGFSTGLYYRINGHKLMHSAGIGIQYQHGMLKANSEMSYDNAQSHYLNYQLSYRIEFVIHERFNLYFQPTFTHTIQTSEKLSEPFSVAPYRAGISFGTLFSF